MGLRDNWYEALELAFDPIPEDDIDVINKRIDEKVQFWNNHINDSEKGSIYAVWIQAKDRIRTEMSDPEIRRKMADEAREKKFGPLDKNLYTVASNGTRPITPDMIRKIAKLRKLDVGTVEKRVKDLKITIAEDAPPISPERYEAILSEHYKNKPPKFASFEGYKANLKSAGFDDFYSFLFPDDEEIDGLTREQIFDIAEAKRNENANGKITAKKTLLRDISADARKTFESDESKTAYDNYLAFLKKRKEIDDVIAEVDSLHDGKCSRSVTIGYIIRLMSVVVDRQKATDLFVAICELKGFSYDISDEESSGLKDLITCKCGKVNNSSDGRRLCDRCGQGLWHICPKCKTESLSTKNFCTCGFDLRNIHRVDGISKQAREALKVYDIKEAKRLLEQAKFLDPEHMDLLSIEADIKTLENRIGSRLAEIERQVTVKNFSQARSLFMELKRGFSQYNNPALVSMIDVQLELAGNKFKEAQSKSDSEEILQLCKGAYDFCRDLPGLREFAKRYTDLPLDALAINEFAAKDVSASVVNNAVVVKLTLPEEDETGIIVAYRFDGFPVSAVDPQAQIKEFSIRELLREGILKIEKAQERNYYIAVYLKFSVSGQSYYSLGAYCRLCLGEKVVLTYSFSKKFLSKRINFEIVPDKAIDSIPQIDLVYNIGHVPVYTASAKHFHTIPSQSISEKFACELDPPSPFVKNTFIKPFIGNNDGKYQLRLASNSSNKVS